MLDLQRCRELLGPDGEDLTDDQVLELRDGVMEVADTVVSSWLQDVGAELMKRPAPVRARRRSRGNLRAVDSTRHQ
jgi:hypothetical protein